MPPHNGKPRGPGRPPGSRNKSTLIFDAIGHEGIADTIRMVKDKADREGSLRAASMLLARTWPRARARAQTVTLDLPPVETAADIVRAQAVVVAAMAGGELTTEEARAFADVLDCQRKAIETLDHELRIQALEAERKAA
jgi:hypothetical protein